jgi:hypothetical protein
MKTQLVFLCLAISSGLAGAATTQTPLNQDKPPRLYVKSYSCAVSSITARHDAFNSSYPYLSSMTESFAYNANVSWSDSSGGVSSTSVRDVATYSPGSTATVIWNVNTYCQPFLSGTQTDTILFSGSPYGSGPYINVYPGQRVTSSDEQCDMSVAINNMEVSSTDITSRNTTYQRTAHEIVRLQTGGKAKSKMRNVFGITGSATQMNQPNNNHNMSPYIDRYYWDQYPPYSYAYWGFYGIYSPSGYLSPQTGANISPQNITIGSYGNMNTNGVKYLILPDNDDVVVTPYVAGVKYYTFNLGQPQKYHSYFDLYVQQANPGYSLYPSSYEYDVGHAFWKFRTDAPADALQYISTNITKFLGIPWGFYPTNNPAPSLTNLFTVPGYVQNDGWPTAHSYNIRRTFYIGFPDLLKGLIYTRGIFNAPPLWCATSFNCVGAACGAGFEADIFGLPWDMTPQNFGVTLIEMYPAPGLIIGPFNDTNDIFYSSAPY